MIFQNLYKWHISFLIPKSEMKFTIRPTVVIIHGFQGFLSLFSKRVFLSLAADFQQIGDNFVNNQNVNLVRAMWKNGFLYGYNEAVKVLKDVGQKVSTYLNAKLGDNDVLWNNLTIVGHGLGVKLFLNLLHLIF